MSENTSNFIFNEIDRDITNGIYSKDELTTRFPPEPNGYLHIGHAKAICINFSVKDKYSAKTNLRFDDTNPSKEDLEYTEAIKEDINWLGFEWDNLCFASSYFDKMYEYAVELINKGLAYIDEQSAEEIKENRGNLYKAGVDSPYRDRAISENLELFIGMRDGKFDEGTKVLRAKIDMQSNNMNMRDPIIYRILKQSHHTTLDKWCIYPMYDFAHSIEDALEKVTHSLCSLEFQDHRPLYDWVLDNLDDYKEKRPRQIEFARLNLTNALTSKRYIKALVDENLVDGWDDPRLSTICAMRRKGITPNAIRNFCTEIGVAKTNSVIDYTQFEYFIREDLMQVSKRVMAIVEPLKVTITNYPENESEILQIPYKSDDENSECRNVSFSNTLYIEREDFMVEPPKKYHRLYKGNEVRFMGAYFLTCNDYICDEDGKVIELLCTYDPQTKSGSGFTERKVKGTIHWVDAKNCVKAEIRHYDNIIDETIESDNFLDRVNKNSLEVKEGFIERAIEECEEDKFQFVRNGFYCIDSKNSTAEHLIFNKTVGLKSSWKPNK